MIDFKWPTLVVAGEPIPAALAENILIRCDPLDLDAKDQGWREAAHRAVTGLSHPYTLPEPEDRILAVLAASKARERLGLLNLHYLGTHRIARPEPGCAGSWLDWDGTLGARTYAIGKSPSVADITDDWQQVATKFPELTLRAQLISYDYDTTSTRAPERVWGTWSVTGGQMEFDPQQRAPLDPPQATWSPAAEPLDLARLHAITARVLAATDPAPAKEHES